MAKEYYKKSTGLAPTNTPKIRIYESVDDALADLDNLEVGDVVASKLVEGAADVAEAQQIIADAVSEIDKVIPDDAGVTNMLVTQDELDEATGEITDKVDPTASSTNKLLSQNAIYGIMDAIEPIGTIKLAAISSGWDSHWHECDGTNGTLDLRECVPVGVGTNGTDTIAEHDVYTLGQFKDDQIQNHTHEIRRRAYYNDADTAGFGPGQFQDYWTKAYTRGAVEFDNYGVTRVGTTTHGKQKGVVFIQKIANYAS